MVNSNWNLKKCFIQTSFGVHKYILYALFNNTKLTPVLEFGISLESNAQNYILMKTVFTAVLLGKLRQMEVRGRIF